MSVIRSLKNNAKKIVLQYFPTAIVREILLLSKPIRGIDRKKLDNAIKGFSDLGTDPDQTENLVVSLTSYPERIYDIKYTLYSLLTQNRKPNKVILWLSPEQFPNKENDLPTEVLNLVNNGLSIKWCNNTKSYKKLVPSILEYSSSTIVTADDDVYYPHNWLDTLYESFLSSPNSIHCHRAHRITTDNGMINSYSKWSFEYGGNSESHLNFATGCGGILYPPNSLHFDVSNSDLFSKLAPNADDIWFWAMATLNNVKVRVARNSLKVMTFTDVDRELGLNSKGTLSQSNNGKKENDIQLQAIIKYYPQIQEIVSK